MVDGWSTIIWSHTPEEFVEELRKRGEVVCVSKGCCKECYYTPDSPIPHAARIEMEREAVPAHRFAECTCAAVAARMGLTYSYIQCYGYYYQHFHENPLMQAAQAAGLVTFVDTSSFPGLRDTPFVFMGFT